MSKKSLTRLGLDPELVRKLNNAGETFLMLSLAKFN